MKLTALMANHAKDATPELREAMQYSLLNPGKRLRPLLVLMAAHACGGNPDTALSAACSVEMIHVFSLIHDDLPAIDNDDMRRGKPANHTVYGEADAIFAGDALLALSFELLATELPDPAIAVACIAALAKATGACGLCGGQSDDLKSNPDIPSVHRRKTGMLFEASAHIGGLLGNGTHVQIQALSEFGSQFGAAFQIADDLQDDHGRDPTSFVGRYGKDESRRQVDVLIRGAVETLHSFRDTAEPLRSLALSIL